MAATSYNGWIASKNPKVIGVDAEFEVHGHRFPGGIKGGDVAMVFGYLGEQLHARVEPIDADVVKDDWGWNYKPSANSPDLLSCHSSATALDWNATRHPNGKRKTFTREQAAEINRILDELRTDDGVRVIQWRALVADGGCARKAPDEMHFEIGYVTPAQVKQVADRLRAGHRPPPAPAPGPIPEEDAMQVLVTSTDDDPKDERWFVTDGITKRALAPGEPELLRDLGLVRDLVVKNIPLAELERIPTVG